MLDAYHFRYDVQQKHMTKEGSLKVEGEVASEVRFDTYIVQRNYLLSGNHRSKKSLSSYYLVAMKFSSCRD
jgi:hypothetical protein